MKGYVNKILYANLSNVKVHVEWMRSWTYHRPTDRTPAPLFQHPRPQWGLMEDLDDILESLNRALYLLLSVLYRYRPLVV